MRQGLSNDLLASFLDIGQKCCQPFVGQHVIGHRFDDARRRCGHIRTDLGAFAHVIGRANRRGKDLGIKAVIVINCTNIRKPQHLRIPLEL